MAITTSRYSLGMDREVPREAAASRGRASLLRKGLRQAKKEKNYEKAMQFAAGLEGEGQAYGSTGRAEDVASIAQGRVASREALANQMRGQLPAMAGQTREGKIAAAKAAGTFESTRQKYNESAKSFGKTMDEAGNITDLPKEAPSGETPPPPAGATPPPPAAGSTPPPPAGATPPSPTALEVAPGQAGGTPKAGPGPKTFTKEEVAAAQEPLPKLPAAPAAAPTPAPANPAAEREAALNKARAAYLADPKNSKALEEFAAKYPSEAVTAANEETAAWSELSGKLGAAAAAQERGMKAGMAKDAYIDSRSNTPVIGSMVQGRNADKWDRANPARKQDIVKGDAAVTKALGSDWKAAQSKIGTASAKANAARQKAKEDMYGWMLNNPKPKTAEEAGKRRIALAKRLTRDYSNAKPTR